MASNKHLTDAERLDIEHGLAGRLSVKHIAANLCKSTSTISREIRTRSIASEKGAAYRVANRCEKRGGCQRRQLCEDKPDCVRRCSACKLCNERCPDFYEELCCKLFAAPYVCNGCVDESRCVLRKKYYLHKKAQEAYRETLVESRVGANIAEDELLALDELFSPLIRRGQSVHHIATNNANKIGVSEKSVYRYVSGGLLNARNIDMPRVCRIKPRVSKPLEHKIDSGCRIGRTYADFAEFIGRTGSAVVEIDSVVGRIGGKVLLTLMFKQSDAMLAFIRDHNTAQSVIDVFDMLHKRVGTACFKALFPVLLTDNGSEFSNPKALEFDADGSRRTHVFYCDPRASFQKANVELNHEFIRRVLPKGTSFDALAQQDINLMMSHINSYSREKLNNKSPLDVFRLLFGNAAERLWMQEIPPNEILLRPSLLKK